MILTQTSKDLARNTESEACLGHSKVHAGHANSEHDKTLETTMLGNHGKYGTHCKQHSLENQDVKLTAGDCWRLLETADLQAISFP